MKYSPQFKLECVQKYKKGERINFEGSREQYKSFMKHVRIWSKYYDELGMKGLEHSETNKKWTVEDRYELVSKVLAGHSLRSVALEAHIDNGQLCQWVKAYCEKGIIGLDMKKGRKKKIPEQKPSLKKTKKPVSETEELILLRERNRYLEVENAYLKKLDALVSKREAAEAKAKKRKP